MPELGEGGWVDFSADLASEAGNEAVAMKLEIVFNVGK